MQRGRPLTRSLIHGAFSALAWQHEDRASAPAGCTDLGWGIQVSGQRIKGWVTSSPSLPVPQAFADCLSAPEGSSSQTYSPSDVAGGLLLQASRGNGGAAAGRKWLRGPSPGCGLQPRAGAAPCWPERGHTRDRSRPGREGTLSRPVQFGQEKTDEEAPELVCGEAGARSQVRAPVKPDAHSRDSDAWRETEVQGGLRPLLPPASLSSVLVLQSHHCTSNNSRPPSASSSPARSEGHKIQ